MAWSTDVDVTIDPHAPEVEALAQRPAALISVPVAMSWGREDWHGSTQEGAGEARVAVGGREVSLLELVRARPELAGRWTRALFGDGLLPVFTKFLRTNFAPFVHFGFATAVDRGALLGWLRTEQTLMRRLLGSLAVGSAADATTFMRLYSTWAMQQSAGAPEGGGLVERWGNVKLDAELLAAAARFLRPDVANDAPALLAEIRLNRARYCATVNLVDLRQELGNMLLSPAGVPHAINGLSEQTHPLDAAAEPLTRLFATLSALERRGAPDAEISAAISAAGLNELRARNVRPPKNEAWFPVEMNGELVLIEPQQTSAVTYSYADFTTPFVWNTARNAFGFRKGDPATGLADADLETYVDALDLRPLDPARARRTPVAVPAGDDARDAQLFRLVDEPEQWPYFTAYLLKMGAGGTFTGARPDGAFQNILALRGTVELRHARLEQPVRLSPDTTPAAIVWATADAGYTLTAGTDTELFLTTVPTPRRTTPAGFSVQ